MLASIYTREISSESQSNRIDESMAKKAVEQYQFVVAKDPKDVESLVMLGKLQKMLGNSARG